MANENGGSGAGQKEACGAQRVARQGDSNGAGGRGPLVLSGYRDGKPFYLYADGTAPAKSKVAVRPIVLDGGVARHAGARRASLHASLHASHCEEQVGTRERLTGGGVAVDCSRTAESPAAIRGGLPSGLTGGGAHGQLENRRSQRGGHELLGGGEAPARGGGESSRCPGKYSAAGAWAGRSAHGSVDCYAAQNGCLPGAARRPGAPGRFWSSRSKATAGGRPCGDCAAAGHDGRAAGAHRRARG